MHGIGGMPYLVTIYQYANELTFSNLCLFYIRNNCSKFGNDLFNGCQDMGIQHYRPAYLGDSLTRTRTVICWLSAPGITDSVKKCRDFRGHCRPKSLNE